MARTIHTTLRRDSTSSPPVTWRHSIKLLVILALFAGVLAVSPGRADAAASRTMKGTVVCQNGKPVTGIWVESTGGGSKWASWTPQSTARWRATYSVSIRPNSSRTNIRLHVGCGGTPSNWWSNNRTGYTHLNSSRTLSTQCTERAGTGTRCRWWGDTVLVGMPFIGTYDRFGPSCRTGAHPSCHHSSGDWSTDLYDPAGGNVYAMAYGPMGKSLSLKFHSSGRTCGNAGYNVQADVWLGSKKLGFVRWGHLENVPRFSVGQNINGKKIGELHKWPSNQPGCWEVNTASGVHTHFTVYNYSSYSCYWPRSSGKDYKLRTVIAKVGKTNATGAKQKCTW